MKTKAKREALNVARKIIAAHLVEGDPAKDAELGIRIDQTLTISRADHDVPLLRRETERSDLV